MYAIGSPFDRYSALFGSHRALLSDGNSFGYRLGLTKIKLTSQRLDGQPDPSLEQRRRESSQLRSVKCDFGI